VHIQGESPNAMLSSLQRRKKNWSKSVEPQERKWEQIGGAQTYEQVPPCPLLTPHELFG
jgi:hypothetical protein